MSDGFAALFWGVLTFSLLVVIHEGGHFVAARLFGVKVHEFMIGLPGPALRLHGKKTTYGITAIPLGGYVRIAGMEPGPEEPLLGPALAATTRRGQTNPVLLGEDLGIEPGDADKILMTLADWDALEPLEGDEYSFRSRFAVGDAEDETALLDRARSVTYRALPSWKRIVVLSMGVVLNLLTAILVFTIVLSAFGYLKETGRIETVGATSAAAKAGIETGDAIVAVEGDETGSWQDFVTTLQKYKPGQTVTVTVIREGARRDIDATLGRKPGTQAPLLGVSPELTPVKPNVAEAFVLSIGYIGLTFQAIAGFFNPQTFQSSISQSSSVIGAAYYAADAARAGALDYAGLVAMLSLSLGVINVLPLPPLDGGKIAVEIFERLRGKPLSRNVSLALSASGAVLLFALIGYLMYSDVLRFIVR